MLSGTDEDPHRCVARRLADSGQSLKSRGIWRETASTAATRLLTHTLDDLERWLRYSGFAA
jgi:hypothetical protein